MATNSYSQIQKQIAELQSQAAVMRSEEVAGVVAKIKQAISTYDLSPEDLFRRGAVAKAGRGATGGKAKSKSSSQAKYADGSGGTWVGRGPRPLWLRDALASGRELSEFEIGGATESVVAPGKKVEKKSAAKKGAARKSTKVSYKDDAGNSWSGFGRRPGWLQTALDAGKTLEEMQA